MVSQRGLRVQEQLHQFSGSDRDRDHLNSILLAVQCLLGLGLHVDDVVWSRYLELEVGVAGDGHELGVTWPPHDDVVGSSHIPKFPISECEPFSSINLNF
jgi:hypothetical protein